MSKSINLTAKQRRFVEEYLIDKNATQAAIRAGYSQKTAYSIGQENLSKPEIEAAVAAGLAKLAERAEITAERVIRELAKIGFADIRRIFTDGDQLKSIATLDDDIAAAVTSVEVVTRNVGRDADGNTEIEHIHKIRLADKRAALVDIGRHLGLFPTKVEHTGPNGGAIQYADVSDMEVSRRIAYQFRQAEKQETHH